MKYKVCNHVVYSCKYHVVWCPKYRRKILTEAIAERLKEVLLLQAASLGVEILEMEIMPDHVHLLIDVPPQIGVNRAVRSLKGESSHTLRSEFPMLKSRLPTLWTQSFFVSTVGGATLDAVKQYIENQNTDSRKGDSQVAINSSD